MQINYKKSLSLIGLSFLLTGCLNNEKELNSFISSLPEAVLKKKKTTNKYNSKNKKNPSPKAQRQAKLKAKKATSKRLNLETVRRAQIEAENKRREKKAIAASLQTYRQEEKARYKRQAQIEAENKRREQEAIEASLQTYRQEEKARYKRQAQIEAENKRREQEAIEASLQTYRQEEIARQNQAQIEAENKRREQEAIEASLQTYRQEEIARQNQAQIEAENKRREQEAIEASLQTYREEEKARQALQESAATATEAPHPIPLWEPNSEDLRLAGENVMALQSSLGRLPSHDEMHNEIMLKQGLSHHQAEMILDHLGL